jgi:hypothetical protein
MGPYGALAGAILGGFFGGQQKMDPAMKRLMDFQMGIANQLRNYGQGVPGSDPQELAALAQARGQLGEEQRGQRDLLYSALGGAGQTNIGDLLANLSNQQVGQRMALSAQALQEMLRRRREALLQSSQVAQAAYGPAAAPREQGPDLAGAFGQFASLYEQSRARRSQNNNRLPIVGGTTPATTLQMPSLMAPGLKAPQYGGISPGFLGNLTLGEPTGLPYQPMPQMALQDPLALAQKRTRGF